MMQQLLYRYLVTHRKLSLPGIGQFTLHREAASIDTASKTILAPSYTILFEEQPGPEPVELYHWIGHMIQADEVKAKHLLEQFILEVKHTINKDDIFSWQPAGSLQQQNGHIHFEPSVQQHMFDKPVKAEKVLRANASHQMRVGEQETTSAHMTELLSLPGSRKNRSWWIWPLVIGLAATIVAIWYFSTHINDSGNAGGYQQKTRPAAAAPSYKQLQ